MTPIWKRTLWAISQTRKVPSRLWKAFEVEWHGLSGGSSQSTETRPTTLESVGTGARSGFDLMTLDGTVATVGTFRTLAPNPTHALMLPCSSLFKHTRGPNLWWSASRREVGLLLLLRSPARENRPMRLHILAFMLFTLGADATSAQTLPASPAASPASLTTLRLLPSVTPLVGVSPHRQSPTPPQSQQQEYDTAVADCMHMWDSGTHMTKQEWARTCKRVQMHLDNLEVDGLISGKSR
jgi:hypothetical protein